MLKARDSHSITAMRVAVCLLAWCALLMDVADCQAKQNQVGKTAGTIDRDKVADAIDKAGQDGPESIYFVEQIAQARAVQAIPMLEQKFIRIQDALGKAQIASALVRLGDKDDVYWDYLVSFATPALESDAPDFMNYDSNGKASAGPSPNFVAWANAHNIAPQSVGEDSVYWLPARVGLLGLTGDPRAIPLLRQALLSPNHMIEVAAAIGLAETQDKDSIPLIIEACQKAPAEAAAVMAKSLVFFDDPQAQSAVDTFIPKDMAKQDREARAKGEKPFGEKSLR